MQGNFNLILLNALEHTKKNSTEKYYTISFLDENDKSLQLYISEDIYNTCKNFKRFDEVDVLLNVYMDKDNKYNFNVVSIDKIPFKGDKK